LPTVDCELPNGLDHQPNSTLNAAAAAAIAAAVSAVSLTASQRRRVVTDGPFMETKEHLLGFFLIDVPDLKTALEWAARMPPACARTVEVRAVKADRLWGRQWINTDPPT
jgi:hypothetical protein